MCGILLSIERQQSSRQLGSFELKRDEIKSVLERLISGQRQAVIPEIVDSTDPLSGLIPDILARGPDYACLQREVIYNSATLTRFSTVLSLRAPFTKQPLSKGHLSLQFNGEIYGEGIKNDTHYFLESLRDADLLPSLLNQLEGEYAYTIHDTKNQKIYFGRDFCGKRSLLYKRDPESGLFFISSVPIPGDSSWIECVGNTIYTLDLTSFEISENFLGNDLFSVTSEVEIEDEDRLISELDHVLHDAVRKRVLSIQPYERESAPENSTGAKLAVLFSGGIDCLVIAAYIGAILSTDKASIPPIIDLLNVSFANKRTGKPCSENPDRILGKRAAEALQDAYPNVTYNFIEIDVAYEEYLIGKERVIRLMYPKDTEMDLSIAIAFHFAAKGTGKCKGVPVQTGSHVLFSGLGADELFGGYLRHSISDKSYAELRDILEIEVARLWDRNLGRDDRVTLYWAREMRYPFLDRSVILHVTHRLPLKAKVQASSMEIKKWALRRLAQSASGPIGAKAMLMEPKRAVQFGARSAKMEKQVRSGARVQ